MYCIVSERTFAIYLDIYLGYWSAEHSLKKTGLQNLYRTIALSVYFLILDFIPSNYQL